MERELKRKMNALCIALAVMLSLSEAGTAYAKDKVALYFFWGNGCPHCSREKLFLEQLEGKYPELEIKSYEVWYNIENAGLFASMAKAYGEKVEGVPTVFVGDFKPIVGYLSDAVTGKLIEENIRQCIQKGCIDPMERLKKPSFVPKEEPKAGTPIEKEVREEEAPQPQRIPEKKAAEKIEPPGREEFPPVPVMPEKKKIPEEKDRFVSIPLLGKVDTMKTSLPVLTLVIAGMDGFNPCAFFVLFLLLSILIYARSRMVMLLIGATFVFFSGLIYFLFMSAWLNIFLVFGHLKVITLMAGAVALVIAAINIKDFFTLKSGVSLTIPESAKPKLFERTRNLLKKGSLPSMMAGTVVLAVAANAYELLCTAGFPMVYTRALTLHNLPVFQYYLYLVLYNLVYVIPLAVIVVIVTVTLGAKKLTESQGQVLKLISGMMMLSLGVVLLVKPDLLNNIVVSSGLLASALASSGLIVLIRKITRRQRSCS